MNGFLRRFAIGLAMLVTIGGAGQAVAADFLEQLVMPGDLVAGHAKLEDDCANCHESFNKPAQSSLCLACHKVVAADVAAATGFHGRNPAVKGADCEQCHTDHQGRDADIVLLDRHTFDHGITDFTLVGRHAGVDCGLCHQSGKKFSEAPSGCVACHKKDDRHEGRLGEACADCHTETGWAAAKFDHDKTDFPLRDAHARTLCASCHPDDRFEGTPTACADCHQLDDVHRGEFGKKCDSCHGTESWKNLRFDHDTTGFPLVGRHDVAKCTSCHTGDLFEQDLPKTCIGCHAKDDVHKGNNGTNCADCHSPQDWKKTSFDHDKDTNFPLRGQHANTSCAMCHRDNAFAVELATDCYSCHKDDDAHKGQQGQNCERCHNESDWSADVRFDHDITRFPLVGLHAAVPCEECHLGTTFKDVSLKCIDCHRDEDEHKGRLGASCGQCHNPNGWKFWQFDHNTQTDYPLDGAHVEVDCESCHKKPVDGEIELNSRCYACHRKDDVHRGDFGTKCEECHVTEAFDDLRLVE